MRSGERSVPELVSCLREVLTALADADPVELCDDEVHAAVPQLLAAVNQLSAVTSTVVGSFDARGLAERDGFGATRTWLTAFGRMSQGAASGWLERGRLLRHLPALAAAAGTGTVSAEQIAVVGKLAGKVGVAELVRFDRVLADLASADGPAALHQACARIHAHLDPDGAEPDPEAAFARREFTLARSGSMTYLKGQLDPQGAAVLHTVLDAFTRPPTGDDPRSPGQRRADALIDALRHLLELGQTPTVAGVRPQIGILVTPTMLLHNGTADGPSRPAGEAANCRTDKATGETAAAQPDAQPGPAPHRPPGSNHPTPPGDSLDPLERLGVPRLPEPPWLHWVGQIPPELAQRIACDAEVWRAILDPATGLPLEVGRGRRLVPAWIRKALHARDRGCRWPGCTAPAAWTDGHHLLPWWLGGRTDVDNMLLLCRHHHTKVHEGHWRLELNPATGEVRIYRPDGRPYELGPSRPWVSPNRQAQGHSDAGHATP